jgi:DNA-binding beta-propeller fold protein YncE
MLSCADGQKPKTDCKSSNCATIVVAKGLTKIAVTDSILATPESVIYDAEKDVAYVSNINGETSTKDGNGFISIINLKGQILTKEWIKGLDAPKGLGIYNHHLFVADINQVVEIDIEKGEIVKKYLAEKAQLLNDISIDSTGGIYISDMNAGDIYLLKDSKLELWLHSDKFEYVNGLFVEGNQLLAGNSNIIYSIDLTTKEMKDYITKSGGIDGLEAIGNNKYIVSDWFGNISIVSPNSPKQLLLSTVDQKINAADLDYIMDKKLILVPTFSNNRVMIYSYVE